MKQRKKGQIGKLAELILILGGAVVLYIFVASVVEKSTFDEVINTCRFSVIAQVATELKPGISGAKSPFNINCEKRYVNFYNNRVEVGLSLTNMKPRPINIDGKQVTKFKTLTDFTVDQVIAEEMRICKFQFADGKEDVFTNEDYVLQSKDVCFVCTDIKFNNVKTNSFNSFLEYTTKTSFDDSRTTYYNYLTEKTLFETPMWIQPFFDKTDPFGNLNIDTSKSYSVLVKKYSVGKWRKMPNLGLLGIVQNARDALTSTKNVAPLSIAIVPTTDINKYCDIQAS